MSSTNKKDKKKKFSTRETIMLPLLLVILAAIIYYLGFWKPLQRDLASIREEANSIDAQIASTTPKIAKIDAMQAELDEIFARPENEITEIAPFDNKEVVFAQLNSILSTTENYSLNFSEPVIEADGTVRRNVSMSFSCPTYKDGKNIIEALTNSRWRCLVSNLSISGSEPLMDGPVSISATITFFESTNLS